MALALTDQIKQLNDARGIVLSNPTLYPQIVGGILPIIGANARLELRRWGADFLAETFASPVVASKAKEQMAIMALQLLRELLEMPGGDDTAVMKGVVEASASIYPSIFKYIIENPSDIPVWNNMKAIKSNILGRWDAATLGVKICCIKFVQKVIQVQTPGVVADPRRPEQNETSIAMVPRDHPLIPPPKLEPEASGLLDRILDVFQQNLSNAVLVNATLNCLGVLLRTRQAIANKIISAVLNFNPLKQANSPMTPKVKVQIKSMERTTRTLLFSIFRRDQNHPMAPRIKQYLDRMAQSRMDIFDEGVSRKRALPSEPTDGLDNGKRRRLGAQVSEQQGAPLSLKGPNSLAQVFTLTNDSILASFDVQQIPQDLVLAIAQGLLAHVNEPDLTRSISKVQSRLLSVNKTPQLGDDEEDYEPDFAPNEDREQILNRNDALPPEDDAQVHSEVALGSFELPQPPPISRKELREIGKSIVGRVFNMINILDEASSAKRRRLGLNRLAGSTYDRDAWVTFITRLATRSSIGLYDEDDEGNPGSRALVKPSEHTMNMGGEIRDQLWKYIMENDFRSRMHVAIAWLNEEWFNDRMQRKAYDARQDKNDHLPPPKEHYEAWALKIFDSIEPYLDAREQRLLIRFLSEIPAVSEQLIGRIKRLARDPERVDLTIKSLYYLILMKPPARKPCIDALEDLWRNNDDARAPAAKLLQKWRPHVLPPAPPKQEKPVDPTPAPLPGTKASDPAIAPESSVKSEGDLKSPTTTGLPVAAAG
ncbi:uncharacterized protein KY384_004140 [Bacidia gigantensis]|uniref:uncharacterized protein n=1 Tax=Bacidia gigantensis TaxID=2732470 RepID=UPI001D04E7C0|nr:uncharacterized protein KY384_004140 [Bacidia gigantensis]KAG8530783.1 hypothetical protein KY384_004140 [Bacidia gigantensis]